MALTAALTGHAIAQERKSIRVVVEGAYPPFNYLDQNNELQGFEVDLLKELCAIAKLDCALVQHQWDGIIRGLVKGEYDAIMSSLEVKLSRLKRIAFSKRYYLIPSTFIARKDSDLTAVTPEALAGKRIAVVDRSEHHAYLEDLYKHLEISTYGSLTEANLDLFMERVDLVLGDKLALSKFLESREGACCRMVADAPYNPVHHGQGYAIGLRKEDEALKAAFDKAIDEAIRSGAYDRIRAKYFPFDIK